MGCCLVICFMTSKVKYEGFDVAQNDQYHVLRKAIDEEANQIYLKMLEEEGEKVYHLQ